MTMIHTPLARAWQYRRPAALSVAFVSLLAACSEQSSQTSGGVAQGGVGSAPVADGRGVTSSGIIPGSQADFAAETSPAPAKVAAPSTVAVGGMPAPAPMPEPTTDRFTDAEQNPVKVVAEEPVSTFSSDVDTASYAVARRYLREGQMPPAGAVRVEEMINYFPYDLAGPSDPARPFTTRVAVMPNPWNVDTKLMTVSIKALDLSEGRRPPLNLVLLVDVSGSMGSPDRLALLKTSFIDFARSLRDEDKISIVTYASGVATVLEPTSGENKRKIIAAIEGLGAGGSTAGADGIERAYGLARANFDKAAVNRVILATDGDFNVGQTDPKALETYVVEQRKQGIYLSVLGVGIGNLNDALMQRMAQAGNGNAAYVDSAIEGCKVLQEEAASTLVPVADDVKFQVEFNPQKVSEYRLIGYETRALRRQDFTDDKIDAGDVGSGKVVTAIYEITPAGSKGYVEPLRYGTPEATSGSTDHGEEFAHLRIRYKQPGHDTSALIERPVTGSDVVVALGDASDDQRFAVAVAAYGQKLAGVSFVAGMPWSQIADLAQGARGKDVDGYRAEFVQLIKAADSID
jgi:Ca-activated chloride channel family protein